MCEFPLLNAEVSLTRDPPARVNSQMTLKSSLDSDTSGPEYSGEDSRNQTSLETRISLEFPLLGLEGIWPGLCLKRRSRGLMLRPSLIGCPRAVLNVRLVAGFLSVC